LEGTNIDHLKTPTNLLAPPIKGLELPESKYDNNLLGNSFRALLYAAIDLWEIQKIDRPNIERAKIVQRLDYLLERHPNKEQKELYIFYKHVCRER